MGTKRDNGHYKVSLKREKVSVLECPKFHTCFNQVARNVKWPTALVIENIWIWMLGFIFVFMFLFILS